MNKVEKVRALLLAKLEAAGISSDIPGFDDLIDSLALKALVVASIPGVSAEKACNVALIKNGFENAYLADAADVSDADSSAEAQEPEAIEEDVEEEKKEAKRRAKKKPAAKVKKEAPAPEPAKDEDDDFSFESFPDMNFDEDEKTEEPEVDNGFGDLDLGFEEGKAETEEKSDDGFEDFDDFGDLSFDDDEPAEPKTTYRLFLRKNYTKFDELMGRLAEVSIVPEVHYVEDKNTLKMVKDLGLQKAPSMAAITGDEVKTYADIKAIVALMESLK